MRPKFPRRLYVVVQCAWQRELEMQASDREATNSQNRQEYNRMKSRKRRFEGAMDSWKKALVAGSIGAATILFMKRKYPAGVLATGVGLALLASEYPESFEKVRRALPDYFDRGMQVMEMAARAGKRITEGAGRTAYDAWEGISG
jgi:hypothetical protein